VSRLENWFVGGGGFRYSNHPPDISPPLVSFVTQTRAGYCQYFAGAMTLMLRYLGIPARLAVGFAGGTYSRSRHAWLVTDRDAHAWVEVWFNGYGWLPFDPTPPAPGFSRQPSLAGTSVFPAGGGRGGAPGSVGGTRAGRGSPTVAEKLARQNRLIGADRGASGRVPASRRARDAGNRGRSALLLLLALAAVAGAIVVAKAGFRLSRRLRREPRRVAAACRDELAWFLVDQRLDVPRSATLLELGEVVQREFGTEPARFVAAATAARFAPEDEAALAAPVARRELRALLRNARRGLTRWERLRGLFSLRSLARPAAVDASASLESVSVGS
jgi:Transglutaminase-like superfamily